MKTCKVINKMPVGENTVVNVDTGEDLFRNGMEIHDEKGNLFIVLSVAMVHYKPEYLEKRWKETTLLIKGEFTSNKVLVEDKG